MTKLFGFIRKNWILISILLVGLILRSYKPLELFMYSHDNDLSGWIVKDILTNHHLRLIGQETTSKGVFIGPLFYYLLIPFYLMTRMDPAGVILPPIILGIFTIFSFYYVFSKIFGKRVGLIASLIYSVCTLIIFTDREPVPSMPAMLWTVWFLYSLWLLLKGNQKSYILTGFLFGLVWNINLALGLLAPLVIVSQILSKRKINFKEVLLGVLTFTILMSPFILFETRHNFQQTKSVFGSITSEKDYVAGAGHGFAKLDRVLQLVHRNTTTMFWSSTKDIPERLTFYLLILTFLILGYKKLLPRSLFLIMFLWQVLYIVFFTLNSINVSEYYLNGMNVIWIGIFAVAVDHLLKSGKAKPIGYFLIIFFVTFNLVGFFERAINKSGYIERKAIVSSIDSDAKAHGYACVAVSYITSPGNDMGYRYFFWLKGMHVNQPKSGSPVYTIVFPLSKVSRVDKIFGALGLILPDYARYTKDGVKLSCSGANSNLTDPMFGYVE